MSGTLHFFKFSFFAALFSSDGAVWEVPASRYAVFTAKGPYPQGLIDVWQAVWKGDLNRRYTADFEVYAPQFDPQARPEVKVLIAID